MSFDVLLISLSLEWSFKIFQKKQPCENKLWTLVALKGKVTFLSTSSRKKRAVIVFGAVCRTNFPRFASSQELAMNGAGALIPQHLRHLRGNVCSSHRKSKDSSRVKGKSSSYLRWAVPRWVLCFKNKAVGSGWSGMVRDGVYHPERCRCLQKAGQSAHSPRVRFEISLRLHRSS